jgi:hypothetical protein
MGSFGGVKIDAQNFNETVALTQEKSLLKQNRTDTLAKSLQDYRVNLLNSAFPDGQYYVTSNFNTQLIAPKKDGFAGVMPVLKQFKKGDLVNVVTMVTDMAMNKVKVIQTDSGNFYADQNKLSKTKPVEHLTTEFLSETRVKNANKTTIMIIGTFILGFLLSKD